MTRYNLEGRERGRLGRLTSHFGFSTPVVLTSPLLIITTGEGVLLTSSGYNPDMLLNILKCTGSPPTTETISRAKVEKPCFRLGLVLKCPFTSH